MTIKEYLSQHGIDKTHGDLNKAVKLLDARQTTTTTETVTEARDPAKVAKEQQVLALLTGVLGQEPELPLSKELTAQVTATLNNTATDATKTEAEKIEALRVGALLMALKTDLGGDLTYPEFAQAEISKEVTATTPGQSVAEQNGWTDYLQAEDKIEYLRSLYK